MRTLRKNYLILLLGSVLAGGCNINTNIPNDIPAKSSAPSVSASPSVPSVSPSPSVATIPATVAIPASNVPTVSSGAVVADVSIPPTITAGAGLSGPPDISDDQMTYIQKYNDNSISSTRVTLIVMDENGNLIPGAKVTLQILSSITFPDGKQTATVTLLEYPIYIPTGIPIEYTASKPGYTTRKFGYVAFKNTQGFIDRNTVSFGGEEYPSFGAGGSKYALSNKPEITATTPQMNENSFPVSSSIILNFSEPMDKASVENNFNIIYNDSGAVVADKSNYDFSWNTTNDQITFIPKNGFKLQNSKIMP